MIIQINVFKNFYFIVGIEFFSSINNNRNLSVIDLSNNSIGSEGIKGIYDYFRNNGGTLKSFNITSNIIGDKGAEYLLNGLEYAYALEELYIAYNSLTNDIGILLGKIIGMNNVLLILDASYNRFEFKSAVSIGKGLAENYILKILRLSYNPFTIKGCLYLFIFL